MTRTSRRWAIAATAFIVAVPVLAGCATGFDANLSKPYSPTEARVTAAKGIHISRAFLLGPEQGATLPQGGAAPLYISILNSNRNPDQLVGATADGVGTVKIASPITLPNNQMVSTGQAPSSGAQAASVTVESLAKPLSGGEYVTINLQFSNAGVIPVSVPVIPRTREFSTYPPASVAPTATPAAPDATATPGATVTPTPTGTPGAEATPGAPTATPTASEAAAGHG
ncbi:copper(I)-binding protein [Thermocatellispora tengchongensis]|uniref:Copper(I)-binding protein n=1 Tax=Thermocatellispora tengchongensis TaxID=1073253 RepID=A0A840PS38_9ACTN|nr:copper chaperone PCu(A)C [Thermocatellispora tengchongensis]MBB5138775.1 copper(I)-binding protein [Thermocatellispora tengchongensis]